ncbi:zinc finger, CCHC-type containing protein [Tanacetum coccineum]
MASMNTRLNIEKLDGNIVQKHGGLKQVGFKQLGPSVETEVHGVHDEKRVWFEVELHRAQGDHEAEDFQVSNDDTAVAQRRLEDKQPEEKTNTVCLVKEQEKEYQTGWKIKTGNVLDSCNQRSTQQCTKSGVAKHLGAAQQNGLVKETNVTLLAKQGHHHQRLKTPIDMLGFFGWLASIKQGMLEPVKVKCIFLGYHKGIVGNKLWRLDDVTSKVLQGDEFEVEPQDGHTFEVEPQENVDQGAGLQEVQTQDLMDYQLARDREQHLACELFGYREDSNETAFAVAAVGKIYAHESLTFNNTIACEMVWFFLADARLRSGLPRIHNKKLVQTLLKGHSILSLEGSLSGDCDVEKNGKWSCIYAVGSQEYQMVCTRLDIASEDVGMLDKFDRGLQTDVQVFVDFDYAMGRSITSGVYDTYRGLEEGNIAKGILAESRYELSLVAGIAIGALVKGGSQSEVLAQVEGAAYRFDQEEVFVVWFFWKEHEGSILFGLPGSRQQKFLVLRFFDVKEQQGIDRLNIEKLDGNIVQKHGGSKQVGFKQLGPGVETGVHGVHDEKRVWFEVELQGAQGDREAEVFQVSNDDTAVAQRRLEDKQPEEKTNTDCLVKEQEKEYQTGWKIKTGNVLDSCNQRSTQQCTKSGVAKHLGVAGLQQQNGLVKETNVTLLAKYERPYELLLHVASKLRRYMHMSHLTSRIQMLVDFVEGALYSVIEGSLSGDCDVEKNGKWSCIYAVGSQEYPEVLHENLDKHLVNVSITRCLGKKQFPSGNPATVEGAAFKIEQRLSLLKNLEDLEHLKRLDIMQKAKVKCAMEGDENSKFFHDMLNTSSQDQELTVIAKVLANRLQQVVHSVISDVQKAYVQGRQIIDGPLIVNEVISWATKNKERLFILKVDFEKAFDSLDWNFLDHTMEQIEFKICKGLRQGNPLSPFLFIIAAEALHVTIEEAKAKRLFEGVKVGDNRVYLSHLQFADDALFKFFGIGVTPDEVSRFASTLCFQPSSFPFVYLGLPIGANMNKTCNWKPVIEKFRKRLTAWKARSLSYGGRLTLSKWVLGALVCSSKSSGGREIGSLFASNVAMLTKWWWRFYSESNSIWKLIVISIHGNDGKIGPDYPSSPLPSCL